MEVFTIHGNVPSLKNGKIKTRFGIISSKAVKDYVKKIEREYRDQRDLFRECASNHPLPLRLGYKFYRNTHHHFDYTNVLDTVNDCLTGHIFRKGKTKEEKDNVQEQIAWIEDDHTDILIPVVLGYEYDKDNPRVEITIL